MSRIILHSDLNSFYASIECLYNPDIRDKPVAVCGSQSTRHGIVLAKNEVAKKFGIKTGEPVWEARSKCPELVTVLPNYPMYLKFSMLARRIYESYTDMVEAFGIDECWLDVTESTKLFGDGAKLAWEIKERIKYELGITASVGVSYNKIFAKLGSDMKKPDAVTLISEENFKKKVWPLPVESLMYVGPSTKNKLCKVGICTIGDLANAPLKFLIRHLGKWGETIWLFANGYDQTPVVKTGHEPIIKGIGNSLTTPKDLVCNEDVKILSYVLAESVGERLRRHNLKGKTVQIWIRASDLTSIERQAGMPVHTFNTVDIAEKAYDIFISSWNWEKNIRSFGIRVTDLAIADAYIQLSLFKQDKLVKRELLDHSIDQIRKRFGHYSVQRALMLCDSSLNANPVEENIIHPVSYFR